MLVLPALDGLRGLAVALVLLRHMAYLGGFAADLPAPLAAFMLNGWVGVDLFFVLSGFLISRPFFAGKPFAWRSYLTRRALRILPAYLFALAVAGWIPFYLVDKENLAWRALYHLLFLQDYLPSDIVIAFWSLGVEEKFYLLAPLLLPLVMTASRPRYQVAILLAVLLMGPASRLLTIWLCGTAADYPEFFRLYRSPFHTCLDGLFLGVLIARLEALRAAWISPARARMLFAAALLALAGMMLTHQMLSDIGAWASVLRPTFIGAVMAGLVAAAVFGGAPSALAWPAARWLGQRSYSLYLMHIPVLYPSMELAKQFGGGQPVVLVIYLALAIVLAHLMYQLIERPFLDLKRRLAPSP